MKKQMLSGLSALALLAGAGVALAQEKGPAAPSAAPGANAGNGGANMEKGGGNPGASERSAPRAAEHGTSSGKSEAIRKGADKGADEAPGKDKAPTQASEKDQRGTSTAKKDPDSSKDRAPKESSKELSSGAASGEAGKANATAEGRNDTSSRSHISRRRATYPRPVGVQEPSRQRQGRCQHSGPRRCRRSPYHNALRSSGGCGHHRSGVAAI